MSDSKSSIAKAYVQIVPTTYGLKKSLSEEFQTAGAGCSSNLATGLKSTIKSALVSLGIGKIISDALTEGSELQQNLGGTEAVFQEYASNIQEIAASAYKNMGMSASEYMATANKMTSLFKGSGMDIATSMDLTTAAMQRAADVASVMGIETEWAMESIAGAAKGNFTMMDNLGVAMNATTLEAYALEKGMINFSYSTATNAEKATLAMEMFMERTKDMAGNFAKESEETLSGSFGAMKSAFSDFLGNLTLGRDIEPSLSALIDSSITYSKNLLPSLVNVFTGLPKAIGSVIIEEGPQFIIAATDMMSSLANGLQESIPVLLAQVLPMLTNFTATLKDNVGMLINSGIEVIMALVQGIVNSLPVLITYVPQIISNIANIINENVPKLIECAWNIVVSLAKGLIDNIPIIIENIGLILTAIWDTMLAFNWLNLASNILNLLANGIASFSSLVKDGFVNVCKKTIDAVKKINWMQLGKDIINGIVQGLKNLGTLIIDTLLDFAKQAWDSVLSFFGIASPSKEFRWVGEMIDRGLAEGIADNTDFIDKSIAKMEESVMNPFNSKIVDIAYSGTSNINGAGSNIASKSSGFNQNINIYSPKELSPSEVARQTRNATRQMALSLNLGGSL